MNAAVGKVSVNRCGSLTIVLYLQNRWRVGSGLQARVCQPQLLISGSVLIPDLFRVSPPTAAPINVV